MEFGKKLEEFTNEELSDIITAFFNCSSCYSCDSCPCDGVLCGFSEEIVTVRQNFALEVAKRLKG